MAQTDIRELVPRVRRAVEGAGAPEQLADDAVKDLVADALAEIILYTGGVFGKQLVVVERDDVHNAPTEYATSEELTLAEASVVAAQAALDYFFHQFANLKVSENIADEAQTWEYALSPNLLRDQLKLLVDTRNQALETVTAGGNLDSYESFLATRDAHTAALIEPWVDGAFVGGQVDFRFDVVDGPIVGPNFY